MSIILAVVVAALVACWQSWRSGFARGRDEGRDIEFRTMFNFYNERDRIRAWQARTGNTERFTIEADETGATSYPESGERRTWLN